MRIANSEYLRERLYRFPSNAVDWFGEIASENYAAKMDAEIQVVGGLLAAPKRGLFLCGLLGVKADMFLEPDTSAIWIVGSECGRQATDSTTTMRLAKGALHNVGWWKDDEPRWHRGPFWSDASLIEMVFGIGREPHQVDTHLNLWAPRLVETTLRMRKVRRLLDETKMLLLVRDEVAAEAG